MKPSLFSHREKLLLGLLCSSMVFSLSFSFSYGAVNQTKVDSIMKMISDAGAKFSDVVASGQTKSERTLYYEKVDAGLGDAVEMLAVVRNKIRSDYLGLSPAYTADEIVGQIIGGVIGNPGTGNPGTGGGNMNPMALCSTDSTLETIAWPHPTRGSYNPLMSVTDTKSKVFTFTVPSGGTSMTISYASTPTNTGKRIQKLYYTLSKQKACTYGDTSIGWSNTLQGGGTLNFPVSTENTSGPYTGNPKLTPGETYYLSFKAQQPLTSDTDKNAPFDLIVEGGTSGGNLGGTSSVWSSASSLSCPTSVAALQSVNPSTYNASTNTSGYQYANISGIYVNVKDYTNPSDTSLPTSCTPGKKWVSKSGANSCSIFTCQGSVTTPPTIPPINPPVTATNMCPAGQSYPDSKFGDYTDFPSRQMFKSTDPTRTYTVEMNIKDTTTAGKLEGELPTLTYAEAPGSLITGWNISISRNPCDFSSSSQTIVTNYFDGWRYYSVNDKRTKPPGILNLATGKWYINFKVAQKCITPGKPADSPNQDNCGIFFELPGDGLQKYINYTPTLTVRDINKKISNATCELTVATNISGTFTRYRPIWKEYLPEVSGNYYYIGGSTMVSKEDYLKQLSPCGSGINPGTTGDWMNAGRGDICKIGTTILRSLPPYEVRPLPPNEGCTALCQSIGGSTENFDCRPPDGKEFTNI